MNNTTTTSVELVKENCRAMFTLAAADFERNPSASNWCAMTRAAFVHQQAAQIKRVSLATGLPMLLKRLDEMQVDDWGDEIVAFTCEGKTIEQVLSSSPVI